MLRRLKMELKKQEATCSTVSVNQEQPPIQVSPLKELEVKISQEVQNPIRRTTQRVLDSPLEHQQQQQQQQQQKVRRVRGRRSSKPLMEKKRRARINQCLDILKSYVLTDSDHFAHFGIDKNASENQDEETIARTILKTSGLINRHRGRKNPNKLEKADILELTVDYVRRLHDQRNSLLSKQQQQQQQPEKPQILIPLQNLSVAATGAQPQKSLQSPLLIKLPTYTNTQPNLPSPPSSSTSCSPQPLLSISNNYNNNNKRSFNHQQLNQQQQQQNHNDSADILDLSDNSKRPKVRYANEDSLPPPQSKVNLHKNSNYLGCNNNNAYVSTANTHNWTSWNHQLQASCTMASPVTLFTPPSS